MTRMMAKGHRLALRAARATWSFVRRGVAVLLLLSAALFLLRTPRPLLSASVTASPEVLQALATGAPVLALESTIITHGMDYPENLETARLLESRAREAGVVPATIAVLRGTPTIGIGDGLERLAKSAAAPDAGILKASRLDLPYVRAARRTAGTTVALTSMLANAVGVRVFATGGIGGAHRFVPSEGATDVLDVSADLLELGRTPVVVVSAGPKAILDLPRTAEILETNSVPVLGYKTDYLPAFWTSRSDIRLSTRVESELEAARVAAFALSQGTGMLLANPIPREHEIAKETIDAAVETILAELPGAGIRGKEVTPYMLRRMKEVTAGRSVEANVALIENNVKVASGVARCLAYPEDGLHGFAAALYRGVREANGLAEGARAFFRAFAGLLSDTFPSFASQGRLMTSSGFRESGEQRCIPVPVYDCVRGIARNPVLLAVSLLSRVPFLRGHSDMVLLAAKLTCEGVLVLLACKIVRRTLGAALACSRRLGQPVTQAPSPVASSTRSSGKRGVKGRK